MLNFRSRVRIISLIFLTLFLLPLLLAGSASGATSIVNVAGDSTDGRSSLASAGGQKLIEDGLGKMIVVYVDSSGRLAVTYSNSDPSFSASWAVPVKSASGAVAYARPAAVLLSPTSLRIIVEGGSGSKHVNDVPVTLQRDSRSNIVGVSFGSPVRLDGSGYARNPTASLAHNGDILAAWNWHNTGDSSRIKTLRWRAGTGWVSFTGASSAPDDAIVDSSNRIVMFPSIIQRPDTLRIYVFANRGESSSATNLVFNKASFDGSKWSWGTQNLAYEKNAARGISDSPSVAWDPGRNAVVVVYDISGTTHYGVFRLDASDTKVHMDTPSLAMTNNEWGSLEIDVATGIYYIFTMDTAFGAENGKLGYVRFIDGSWEIRLTILDSDTNNVGIAVKRLATSGSIDLLYTESISSSTSKLKFVRISTVPVPPKLPSALSISSTPNPSNDSQPVTFSGFLTDANTGAGLGGQRVSLEQSVNQVSWTVLAQTVTASDGSYRTAFSFVSGTFYVRAGFQGDATYAPSTSPVLTQIVRGQSTSSHALVVDNSGNVYRFQGSSLAFIARPTSESLRSVAWRPDGSYALIVGHAATLLKYDGTQFTPVATGVSSSRNFQAVAWKQDGSFALIAGSAGTVLKYDGVSVSMVPSPATTTLRAISWHPSGSSALLVGDGGAIVIYENGSLRAVVSGTTSNLYSAAWSPIGTYALVAGSAGTILRYDGSTITFLNTSGLYSPSHIVRGIAWNSTGNIAVLVGDTGLVLTYDGSRLTRLSFNGSSNVVPGNLYAVAWFGRSAYIVGGSGVIFVFAGSLSKIDSGVSSSLRGIGWLPQ